MNKKIFVFIDGGNFYFKMKEMSQKTGKRYSLLKFRFRDFCKWLAKDDELLDIRYYVGAVNRERNNEKSETMYANQQKLIGNLQQQNVNISLGQLIKHPDKTYHEKGVDVRLAVEMIRFARENKYDVAYLISSDTDLVPAVEEVRAFGKEVCYVGIFKGQSFGLSKASNNVILLRTEEIEKFLKFEN
ncbi:MAG: NYN domain-containing protein [Patescibacteria group bacterium]